MKVTVIIPTYKPQDYIWDCLNSLVNQTLSKECYEIIIVLNGCENPWQNNIKVYINDNMRDVNVTLVQTYIPGVSNARNVALDIAKGEFITFIDDDDYVSQSYLEDLVLISNSDAVVLSNTIAFNDENPNRPVQYHVSKVYETFHNKSDIRINSKVRTYFSGPCMKLIPRKIIGQWRFDTRLTNGEDSVFMFQISNSIKHILFTPPRAVYYRRFRRNSALTSKRTFTKKLKNALICITTYTSTFLKGGYNLLFYLSRVIAEIRSIMF